MLEHYLGWLSLEKDLKFWFWNLLHTSCLRSVYLVILENDEGMTVLDYGVFILLVDLAKVRGKLVEKRFLLLQVMLVESEILKHVYGI